jgi:hypothetical protein
MLEKCDYDLGWILGNWDITYPFETSSNSTISTDHDLRRTQKAFNWNLVRGRAAGGKNRSQRGATFMAF